MQKTSAALIVLARPKRPGTPFGTMSPMRVIADETRIHELLDRLAAAITADMDRSDGDQPWALVGVRSRGDILARRLADRLRGRVLDDVGALDITLYRDDLSELGSQAVVQTTEIPFDIEGLHVVLVDDVLMTGRSIRAALQSLIDLGRPRRVWLSVLVDRGGRELPIAADHAALDLTGNGDAAGLGPGELVEVRCRPVDNEDAIRVRAAKGAAS